MLRWHTLVSRALRLALLLTLLLGAAAHVSVANAEGLTIFVKADATGLNNGSTWADAYTDLATAITSAVTGDEIWVAAGIYRTYIGGTPSTTATFMLKDGVAIYGGFNGTETLEPQRDPALNLTILSGVGYSYHVVTADNTVTPSAVLDGFTISGGRALGSSLDANGGGMLINGGSPTLANLTIRGNWAYGYGGGLYNEGGSPAISSVTFLDNQAVQGGGMYNHGDGVLTLDHVVFEGNSADRGGGLYTLSVTAHSTGLTVSNAVFRHNVATQSGGGILVALSDPTIKDSLFSRNSALMGGGLGAEGPANPLILSSTFEYNWAVGGGGLALSYSNAHLTNVTLLRNTARDWGGALSAYQAAPVINNATLVGNAAPEGSVFRVVASSNPVITNSILWGNGPAAPFWSDGSFSISDSIVQGGCPLTGTPTCERLLTNDPLLEALLDDGDHAPYMPLGAASPAIDAGGAGCATDDARGLARPQGPACDMGAYEMRAVSFTSVASYDGWVLETSENGGTGGTMNSGATTLRLGDDALKRQVRSILSFNTITLPDNAAPVLVRLGLKHQGATGSALSTLGALRIDLKKGTFGGTALELADFNAAATRMSAGSVNTTPVLGWYIGTLVPAASLQVNRTGVTQLRLRFNADDDNDKVADTLSVYSANAPAGSRPLLWVYYKP